MGTAFTWTTEDTLDTPQTRAFLGLATSPQQAVLPSSFLPCKKTLNPLSLAQTQHHAVEWRLFQSHGRLLEGMENGAFAME